jgi:hypothetical protein
MYLLQSDIFMDVFSYLYAFGLYFNGSVFLSFYWLIEEKKILILTLHDRKMNHRVVFPFEAAGAALKDATSFFGPLHLPCKEAVMDIVVPCPDCIRQLPSSFAWIDHHFRNRRFLGALSLQELAVYLFFVLAADKHGVSFYRIERIADFFDFQMQPDDILNCRTSLREKKLIGFMPFSSERCEGFCQVLPLPVSRSAAHSYRRGGMSCIGNIIRSFSDN